MIRQRLTNFVYDILNYHFKNEDLLVEAFTHPSVRSENIGQKTYERLEFLGDTILSFVMADFLFHKFSDENEGLLSKRLVNLICRDKLYEIANKIGIANFLIMTHGEEKNGGRTNINSLSNSVESLIAALFIDGGIMIVKKFINKFWHDDLHNTHSICDNAKSILQERLQARNIPLPSYNLVSEVGLDHSPEFTIKLTIEKIGDFFGKAGSKKKAEIAAAKEALAFIEKQGSII